MDEAEAGRCHLLREYAQRTHRSGTQKKPQKFPPPQHALFPDRCRHNSIAPDSGNAALHAANSILSGLRERRRRVLEGGDFRLSRDRATRAFEEHPTLKRT